MNDNHVSCIFYWWAGLRTEKRGLLEVTAYLEAKHFNRDPARCWLFECMRLFFRSNGFWLGMTFGLDMGNGHGCLRGNRSDGKHVKLLREETCMVLLGTYGV